MGKKIKIFLIIFAFYNIIFAKDWQIKEILKGYDVRIWISSCLSFSPDGRFLVTGGHIIFLSDNRNIFLPHRYHYKNANSFSPDGKYLASGSIDGSLILIDLEELEKMKGKYFLEEEKITKWEATKPYGINCIVFSKDGKEVITGAASSGAIKIWNAENGKLIKDIWAHRGGIMSLDTKRDGNILASAGSDWKIILWNIKSGEKIKELNYHTRAVTCVKFSPDEKILATSGLDGAIVLWDTEKRNIKKVLKGDNLGIWSISFSPDGNFLASGGADKRVKIWDLKKGKIIKELEGHNDHIYSVSFSADGKYLASGDKGQVLYIWEEKE